MKKLASILLIVSLCACYGKKPVQKTGLEGKLMPAIDLKLIDTNSRFNTESIQTGNPTILFAFEPWCPFCKAQTKAIVSHMKSFKDVNFYFLTNAPYPEFKDFAEKFELNKYQNITVGIDYKYSFAKYFKINQIPVMAVYDKEKKLKQVLIGKNYISTIKDALYN